MRESRRGGHCGRSDLYGIGQDHREQSSHPGANGVFRRQIQTDPDLALRILASMSLHLRYLVETVESLKLKQAESRVVQWLLSQLEEQGKLEAKRPDFTLPLAKHLLASQLGITSETLSRVFSRLRKQQLAVIEGRHLRDLDVVGLRRFLAQLQGRTKL